MHSQEWNELLECCDCAATIEPGTARAFALDGEVLCFECAIRRGGVYDEPHDRWLVAPKLEDEPDERRPHP